MGWQYTVFVYPTLVAAVISVGLATYTTIHLRRHGQDQVRLLFLGLALGLALWTGFSALKLLRTDPATKLLFYRCLYVGVAPLGPLSVLFALAYTDRQEWLRPSVVAALVAPPAVYLLLVFANPYGLAIRSYDVLNASGLRAIRVETGPAHLLIMTIYSPLIGFLGVGIVAREALRLGRAYLPQAVLLTVAILAPAAFSLLTAAGIPPFTDDGPNLIPTSAAVSAAAFGVATFRYRWFDLPPIAYTTVMEHSPDGVIVVDPDGTIVHANPSGQAVLDRLSSGVNDPVDATFSDLDPGSGDSDVLAVETDAGEDRYLEIRSRPIDRRGEQVGTVLVVEDVTERHGRRRELRAQKRRLNEFASVVSHDLRNPLSVASATLATLDDDHDAEAIESIENAHERIEALIDDLLVLAREGEGVDDLEPVGLAAVARESWETAPTDDASLEVADEPGRRVVADRSRLRQLFGNLFRNSVEHGSTTPDSQARQDAVEHGGEDVTVTVGTMDGSGGFYVEDDGLGIPEAEREKVLESGYTTATDGTGLGLPIADRIADAHGWDLSVTTGTDGGARFEVTGVEFEDR